MNNSRMFLSAVTAIVAGLAAAQMIASDIALSLMTQATIFAVFALGLGVLLRQNGVVSFGHAAWFGLSSYVIAILLKLDWVSAELAIVIAVAGLGLAAFLVGLVIVRLPGVAFSMLTLSLGMVAYLTAERSRGITGGTDGMNIDWPQTLFGLSVDMLYQPRNMMMISWTVLVLLLLGLGLLLRTRFGSITEAVRDNEERARFIGINTLLPRAAVYALSVMVTALAGVLAALNTGFISPESLHWSLSGAALMMVVVGGTRVLWGPALGAVVYFFVKDVLGEWTTHWMSIFGLMLIVIIVFAPEGLSGLALDRLNKGRRGKGATSRQTTRRMAKPVQTEAAHG